MAAVSSGYIRSVRDAVIWGKRGARGDGAVSRMRAEGRGKGERMEVDGGGLRRFLGASEAGEAGETGEAEGADLSGLERIEADGGG